MPGFNWFWDRTSYKWIVSTQAACLFGLASILICCLTVFLFGGVAAKHVNDGILLQAVWAVFGVTGTLSCFFLMSGMKKYREIVEIRTGERRARFVSFSLLIGVWYAAIVYFLLVYLPARPNLDGGRVR
jgi:hypothetical protein